MELQTYMLNDVEALYPRLDQPYKFQQGGGKNGQGATIPCQATAKGAEYTTKFKMNKAQAKELFKAMVAAYDEAKQDSWNDLEMPFEKEDGHYIGKAKIAAAYGEPLQAVEPPRHYDSNNQRLDDGFQLTTGSTVNLYLQLYVYNGSMGQGISLRLRGIQVTQFKEFIAASPFETQEGYTQRPADPRKDDIDSIFDAPSTEEPKAANEEVTEPKVRANKKKAEPPANNNPTDLLDEFDD